MKTNVHHAITALALAAAAATGLQGQAKIEFEQDILPILERSCVKCHRATYTDENGRVRKPKAGLRVDSKEWLLRGTEDGKVLIPGDPDNSPFYSRTVLPEDHDDFMPAKGDPLTRAETDRLKQWIAAGADFGRWTGVDDTPPAPPEDAKPATLSTERTRVIDRLGKSLAPAATGTRRKAAGDLARITPAQPGSALLRVEFISNESQVRDAQVLALAPLLGHVTELNLAGTKITDRALATIGRMKRLTRLDLHGTGVTDAGLRALRPLGELRYLNLYGTKITDRGLGALVQMPHLEAVYLWQTGVTNAGAERLRRSAPRARVNVAPDLPAPAQDDGDGKGRGKRKRKKK